MFSTPIMYNVSNLTLERVHSIKVVVKIYPVFENLIWYDEYGT